MDYPIEDLLSQEKSYQHLVDFFHGGQLVCPTCRSERARVHSRRRAPILMFQCRDCKTYYNLFSGTAFKGTHWACSKVVLILRGFAKGDSTASMSRELGLGRRNLLGLRHELMANAYNNIDSETLPDWVSESDELYQNAGEKGIPHRSLEDPPRIRANKKKA